LARSDARNQAAISDGPERLRRDARLARFLLRGGCAVDEARDGHGCLALLVNDEHEDAVGIFCRALAQGPLNVLLCPRDELGRDGLVVQNAAAQRAQVTVLERQTAGSQAPTAHQRRSSQLEVPHLGGTHVHVTHDLLPFCGRSQ